MKVIKIVFLVAIFSMSCFCVVIAQSSITSLSGIVTDESDAVISGVEVTILNIETGYFRETKTDDNGAFSYYFLPPGKYKVTIIQSGFTGFEIQNLFLESVKPVSLKVRLKVGGVSEVITVSDDNPEIYNSSSRTVIDRPFIENLPSVLNDVLPFISLTPGAVRMTAGNAYESGHVNFNGQRYTSNYFIIDGVSANIQSGSYSGYQQAFSGSLPGINIFGGYQNLVQNETLQEVNLLTSSYAPEFGRTSGAQISITTRSGTSNFHGKAFNYFLHDLMNMNIQGIDTFTEMQNNYGGILSGPISISKVLTNRQPVFLFSYEGLQVNRPGSIAGYLPSKSILNRATPEVEQYFKAFPVPPIYKHDSLTEYYIKLYTLPAKMDAFSGRIDQAINKNISWFFRINESTNLNYSRKYFNSARRTDLDTRTITLGATQVVASNASNEIRANHSIFRRSDRYFIIDLGGATPFKSTNPDHQNIVNIEVQQENNYSEQLIYNMVEGHDATYFQHQFNIVDNFSIADKNHQYKFGFDYRKLSPRYMPARTSRMTNIVIPYNKNSPLKINVLEGSTISAKPLFTNLSFYGQDSWNTSDKFSITYGLRWELNPAPKVINGLLPPGIIAFNNINLVNFEDIPKEFHNIASLKTSYTHFAPRLGAAYKISNNTTIRGGIGYFYDLGASYTSYGFNQGSFRYSNPYSFKKYHEYKDLFDSNRMPLLISLDEPKFSLPSTLRFSAGIEHSFSSLGIITASYVGALGKRLANLVVIPDPNTKYPNFGILKNEAGSSYHSLQIQYQHRLSPMLQILANSTISRSRDNVSDSLKVEFEHAPSDFDMLHTFSCALSYKVPDLPGRFDKIIYPSLKIMFKGWSVDSIFNHHTALPYNVDIGKPDGLAIYSTGSNGRLMIEDVRPNLNPNVLLYKDYYGQKQLNSEAFYVSRSANGIITNGNLGRNTLRGEKFNQVDVSFRRTFKIINKIDLQFRLDVFNFLDTGNYSHHKLTLYDLYYSQMTDKVPDSYPYTGYFRSTSHYASDQADERSGNLSIRKSGGRRSYKIAMKIEF